MPIKKQTHGKLFIISAPSGAGKSTLCSMMINKYPELMYSVSYTTRAPRGSEQHGVDYFFVSKDEFAKMITENEFIEWAEVHGNYYGTSAKYVNSMISRGKDVFLDIDPQGALQLKNKLQNAIFIFITAPSLNELKTRLINRGTDRIDVIENRLINAKKEVQYFSDYDYLIINDESDKAFADMEAIYRAEKLRTTYFKNVLDFMDI